LPRELRDIIYSYALTGHVISLKNKCVPKVFIKSSLILRPIHDLLALTVTCRQTHTESAHVIFRDNVFSANIDDDDTLTEIVDTLAAHHRSAIATLLLEYCDCTECLLKLSLKVPFAKLPGLEKMSMQVLSDLMDSKIANPEKIKGKIQTTANKEAGKSVCVELVDE
jgi:hypothetical protein